MADEKAVVLKSAKPFESNNAPMTLSSWFKFYYRVWGLIAVSMITIGDLHGNELMYAVIGATFWLTVIFAVLIVISKIRNRSWNAGEAVAEVLSKKFKLTDTATLDEIFSKLEKTSKEDFGNMIKVRYEGKKVIATYFSVDYEIILNGDGTFSIIGENSSKSDKDFYDEIRFGTPIIAFWLQQSFGVTSTSGNELGTSSGQTIQEIYERTKRSANNSSVTERRQEIAEDTSVSSRNKKIIAAALVAIAGLMIMLVSYDKISPITVDRFIEHYNKEIKRTAGAVVQNKYHGQSKLVENCTLNNVKIGQGCKYQTLFGKNMYTSIYFTAYDSDVGGQRNESINIGFSFYDEAPVDAVFAIIEATIAAVGDDEEKVAQALGILAGNHYNIPYNYNKKITFNDKEYSITPFDRGIVFSVTINNTKKR